MIFKNNLYNKNYFFKDCQSLIEFSINDIIENDFDNYNPEFDISKENKDLFHCDFSNAGLYSSWHNDQYNNSFYYSCNYISEVSEKNDEENKDKNTIITLKNKLVNSQLNFISVIGMFYNCSNLTSLKAISKWNNNNFINIKEIFYNCSSLKSLPDISK